MKRTLVLPFALLACGDPAYFVHTSTVTAACQVPGQPPTPVAGAAVFLRCGKERWKIGETDAEGHLHHISAGWMRETCRVDLEKAGFRPRSYSVNAFCIEHFGDHHCHAVNVNADLVAQ